MLYLHPIDPGRLIVENVDVGSSLGWSPILCGTRVGCLLELKIRAWWILLLMTASARELLRIHEVVELLVCSGELKT